MNQALPEWLHAEPRPAARQRRSVGARRLWLLLLGLPRTLRFNLRYFPLRTALRLPVLVSHRVWLRELGGEVHLGSARTGAVRIGFGDVGIFDQQRSRTIWQVSGIVTFAGTADIGHGSRIAVTGTLLLGDGVQMVAESAIVAQRAVAIGDGCLISWDVLIIDTDGHEIYDARGTRINSAAPIAIGNSVWLGCRSVVLKGVRIADGVVVAAAATVTRPVESPNVIVGGSPARVVKENIRWKR